jgi:mannose-6-phosphate isomerase-like protein (cupin superfamily)
MITPLPSPGVVRFMAVHLGVMSSPPAEHMHMHFLGVSRVVWVIMEGTGKFWKNCKIYRYQPLVSHSSLSSSSESCVD